MSELDIDAMVTGPNKQDLEIKQLRTQLAKANEIISKLELEGLPDDYIAVPSEAWREQCQHEVQLAEANKRIEELEHYNLKLANESHAKSLEIDKANKLTIEKKLEGAYAVISLLDETKDSKAILMANKYVREQLREKRERPTNAR